MIRERDVAENCVIKRVSIMPLASSVTWTATGADGRQVEKASRFLHDDVQMKPGQRPQPGQLAMCTLLGCSNKTTECRTMCGAYLCKAGPEDTACPGEDCDELIRDDVGNLLPHGTCNWAARLQIFQEDPFTAHIDYAVTNSFCHEGRPTEAHWKLDDTEKPALTALTVALRHISRRVVAKPG